MEKLEKILFIQLISTFALSIATILLTNILPLNRAVLISFITCLIINLYIFIKNIKIKELANSNYFRIFLFLAFIFIVISYFYLQHSRYISNITDHIVHTLVVKDIIENNNLPPFEPCVPGERVAMTWFYYLISAIISISLNIPAEYGLYLMNIYSLIISMIFIFLIAKKLFYKLYTKLFFIIFTIMLFIQNYYVSSPNTFALIFLFAVTYILLFIKKEKILLASTIIGISIFFHGYIFLLNLIIFFGYVIYSLVFETRELLSKKFIREIVISSIACSVLFLFFIIFREKNNRMFDIIFFEPLGGLMSFTFFVQFLPFIIFSTLYIIKPTKLKREVLVICNMIISIIIFSSSLLLLYGGDLPGRFYFFTLPFFYILSFLLVDNIRDKKMSILLLLILTVSSYSSFFTTILLDNPYFSQNELNYYYTINEVVNDTGAIVASSPDVVYTYFSQVKQIICEPYLQLAHLTNVTVVKRRFEDLLRFYKDPSQEFIKNYNISYVIFGENEKNFLQKYDTNSFKFSNSPAFKEVYASNKLWIFNIVDTTYLPARSNAELNYTYYSRWWSLPPTK